MQRVVVQSKNPPELGEVQTRLRRLERQSRILIRSIRGSIKGRSWDTRRSERETGFAREKVESGIRLRRGLDVRKPFLIPALPVSPRVSSPSLLRPRKPVEPLITAQANINQDDV
jgi:hypothetical protein